MSNINIRAFTGVTSDDEEYYLQLQFIGEESKTALIELLNRALNTWDTAPNEFKALADYVIHGRPLQNYGGIIDPEKMN